MNVLVSSEIMGYAGFLCVETLAQATNISGVIDTLVYHCSNESSTDCCRLLAELKYKYCNIKFVYIRNLDSVDEKMKILIVGYDGKYIDDEMYLESQESLSSILGSLDEVVEVQNLDGVSMLKTFLSSCLQKNGNETFTKANIRVVSTALENIIEGYTKKNDEIIRLSQNTMEIFEENLELFTSWSKESSELKEKLDHLADLGTQSKSVDRGDGQVYFFGKVSYSVPTKILRIKELGNVPFLKSFLIGYRTFLDTTKYINTRLIIINPVGSLVRDFYKKSNIPYITRENMSSFDYTTSDVVFVEHPTSVVLTNLLKAKYDYFIVLDTTILSKEHLLNSCGDTLYALSSNRMLKAYNIPPEKCIYSVNDIRGGLVKIPKIPDYPIDKELRERSYQKNCDMEFSKIYGAVR